MAALFSLSVLLLAASPAPAAGDGLSLDEAVTRALGRHPAVAAQEHAVLGGEARVDQAESAWLPRATVSAWYRYSGPVPELALDTGITPPGATEPLAIRRSLGSEHSAGVQALVAWRALDFGARDARSAAARAMTDAARADGDARQADIAFAVRSSYLAARLYDEVVAVTQRALESARKDKDTAEQRRKVGLSGDVAVAANSARTAELEARLADAASSAQAAREALALLLGLPTDAELTLTDGLEALAATTPAAGDPAHTPALAGLAATDAALSHEDEARARSRLPTVDLFVQGAFQYPKTFVELEAGVTYAAGVSLTWDAFDGGLVSAQREELAERRAQLQALSEASREDTARAVATAAARARAARASIAAGERTVAASEVYVRAARGALGAGAATELEVRSAEAALDQAQLGLVRARFASAMAEAERLRALGVARTDTPETMP